MKAKERTHADELVAPPTAVSGPHVAHILIGGARALLHRRPARIGKTEMFELLLETLSDLFDAQIRAADGDSNGASQAYARAAERLAATTDRFRDAQPASLASRTAREHGSVDSSAREELTVDRSAVWFRVGSDVSVDCSRHGNVRNALLVLIEAHVAASPTVVSWQQLAARLWPGEVVIPRAAKNRVRVTIAHLRRSGLARLIVTEGDGYRLGERVLVRVVNE